MRVCYVSLLIVVLFLASEISAENTSVLATGTLREKASPSLKAMDLERNASWFDDHSVYS